LAFHYAPSGYTERYFATGETLLQEDRLNLWESGYQMFLRSPLIGWGTGAFHEYMGGWVRYPHNIFIEIGAELGLVGLGVFVAFLLLTLRSAMKVILAPLYDDDVKQMMLILLICFTFCLVAAQFSLDINGNSNIWLFSGLIWAVSLAVTPRNMTTRRFATEGEESGKKVGWH
jgi:O-antigen ligase